jgi:hypothetical protein
LVAGIGREVFVAGAWVLVASLAVAFLFVCNKPKTWELRAADVGERNLK